MATLQHNNSDDLTWLLIRDFNSFIVKRKHDGIRTMSKEPGNLLNRHSPRYSGLAHSKPVTIQPAAGGKKGLRVSTRNAKSSVNAVKGGRRDQALRAGANSRKSHQSTSRSTGEYRPDLHKAVLGRTSAILKSQNPPRKQKTYRNARRQHSSYASAAKSAIAADEE